MGRLGSFNQLALLVLAGTVCLCAARRPKFLDDLLTTRNVVPGHIDSVERIPGELHVDDVETLVLSEKDPAPEALFGTPYDFRSSGADLTPGIHPRIAFNKNEWDTLIENYAFGRDLKDSWANSFLKYTLHKGPKEQKLTELANLDTSAYTGKIETMDKEKLKELAKETLWMGEYHSSGMFISALHAFVNEKYSEEKDAYLMEGERFDKAVNIIVNYAKVLLAHHATYACVSCEYKYGMKYSDLWNPLRGWNINNDWTTAGIGMAMAYDVLYDRMSAEQQMFVNSAIGLMVKDRQHWGITDFSNKYSPNAEKHPHRIFSNWATYHANLYLTNLVIEGEYNFDEYATSQNVSYNEKISNRTVSLFKAFVDHSINPEGSTFEDGYMYSLAFREGSLAFIALARRGFNHMDTPKFRNFIYNGAQMHEPFRCGHFIGHSSGGGALYPASYALFRYAYPESKLANMMWAQRMGLLFRNYEPCRIWWHQVNIQMAILAGEHMIVDYESPAGLDEEHKELFGKSIYFPRRGLLVARSDHSEQALYFHFDGRPDAWVLGHDNADRGVVTLSSHGRTWLDDYPWRQFPSSQVHSLMHIDGQAQALKAPGVRMLKVKDDGKVVLSAADLTYAYNVQWARAWSSEWQPFHWEYVYQDGVRKLRQVVFTEKEEGSPSSFGWPLGDDPTDLGILPSTKIWGEKDLGFAGSYIWKRNYRQVNLKYGVRSTALVRGKKDEQYVILGDNFAMSGTTKHKFDQYFIFAPGVHLQEISKCDQYPCECPSNPCVIYLTGGDTAKLELHVSTLGNEVSYNTTKILVSKYPAKSWGMRLIVSSNGLSYERFCTVLFPHSGGKAGNLLLDRSENMCKVRIGDDIRGFKFSDVDRTFDTQVLSFADMTPYPSPSSSASVTPSVTASPSVSSSILPSPSASLSYGATLSMSPTISSSLTASMTPSVSSSISVSPSTRVSASSSITTTSSVTPSYLHSIAATPSVTLTASPSTSENETEEEEYAHFVPMDPLPLPDGEVFSITQSEISLNKPHFFFKSASNRSSHVHNIRRDFVVQGQIVFDVLAFQQELMVITTCFDETNSNTNITVWDCGPFGENGAEAYNNYYNRQNCRRISNLLDSPICGTKDVFEFIPDNANFDDDEFGIYFVVVSVDESTSPESSRKMKFLIQYDYVNGTLAEEMASIGDEDDENELQYDQDEELYD